MNRAIPKNITDYIARFSIATRIATNAYSNTYGPQKAKRSAPSPELLKFIGDVADALHNIDNIDNGLAHFYASANKINSAWESHKDKLVHDHRTLAIWLLPLPTAPDTQDTLATSIQNLKLDA